MKIPVAHVNNLLEYARHKAIVQGEMSSYSSEALNEFMDDEKIDSQKFIDLFQQLKQITKDPYFGLHFGSFLNLNALRFVNHIQMNATHINQAIYILQEYFKNSFPVVTFFSETDNENLLLQFKCNYADVNFNKQILDTVLAFVYREIKLIVPEKYEPIVLLPYPDLNHYNLILGSQCRSGSGHCLSINKNVLELPINQDKASEIEYLLPSLLMMLEYKEGDGGFSQQVKRMILKLCNPYLPDFQQVLAQFAMSRRSFQRKLHAENNSFRQIMNKVKYDLYSYLIKGESLQLQDIAFLLGYSESSALLHAVDKWRLNFGNH